jgi:hypothetical protein
MIVLAGTAAWLAWQRIETIEQQHEEQVSMTLAAVKHELEQQRMSLNTIHDHVHRLTAQVSAASSPASTDLPLELSALKQHVEELELTIGAYGALLGKQQHTVVTHAEQLTTHEATLRSLTTVSRPAVPTATATTRKRAARRTPPTLVTELEAGATPTARPAITLPANLGAWSLGVRNPVP